MWFFTRQFTVAGILVPYIPILRWILVFLLLWNVLPFSIVSIFPSNAFVCHYTQLHTDFASEMCMLNFRAPL